MKKTAISPKQLTALILLFAVFVTVLSSCASKDAEKQETAADETSAVQETETPVKITDEKFTGEEFNIAYMTGGSYGMGNEVYYSFEDSETSFISSAVYERNRLTEERLDITIKGTFINPSEATTFNNYIMNLVQAGDTTYDAICNYLRYNYWLVQQQGLLNIREIDSFCLDNPWWDKGVNESFSFMGKKQFFATGDICFDDDCTIQIMIFSKKLHGDYGLEQPYKIVKNGGWTLDKLVENMALAYNDLNGDGIMDRNDCYGLSVGVGSYLDFMKNMNAPSAVIDEKGIPRFAYTYQPEKMTTVFNAIFDKLIVNPGVVVTEYDLASDYSGARNMFGNDQFMYCGIAIGSLESLRNQMEDGFGVIPFPKLDEKQEKYYSSGSMWASTYAVPVTSENPDRTGAILNVMGYYSVDTVTETVIQKVVMNRNLRDIESEEMVRIAIREKIYDIGLVLALGDFYIKIYDIAKTKTNTFVSDMESIQPKFEADIEALIEAYTEAGAP